MRCRERKSDRDCGRQKDKQSADRETKGEVNRQTAEDLQKRVKRARETAR